MAFRACSYFSLLPPLQSHISLYFDQICDMYIQYRRISSNVKEINLNTQEELLIVRQSICGFA